jgi:hypothetical protein
MLNNGGSIIAAALQATTPAHAAEVQKSIALAVGTEYQRPVGDKWNNHGLMGAAGSFDLKLIEPVTNMQDAILERKAIAKWGSRDAVPYRSPHEAAADLLTGSAPEQAAQAAVFFREAADDVGVTKRARHTKILTAVFDDAGCGLVPASIPTTIFGIGGSHKESALFLQGAFGMGGAMTYRNAEAVVLVTRRAPELLADGEEDLISVAVVQWRENTKGRTAFYLVTSPWDQAGDVAVPWSAPAASYPDFSPGTHLALIGYRVDGFHRQREGDEKSFDVVANTRLLRPVMPIRFVNETTRARNITLRGLENRLDNAYRSFPSGTETLPFTQGGTTYLLPMRYTLFEKPREAGGRDKFVAHDHAVVFTSNGQVHHHWTPMEFRNRTQLNKLHDRILVVVETDALPIRLRTSLFTADRNDLVRGDAAIRLEADVAGFIRGWAALIDENNALLRDSLKGSSDQKTLDIARRIGRALSVKGFGIATGSNGSGGGGGDRTGGSGGGGGTTKPVALHADPTKIVGPESVRAVIGETRAITYIVDVVDSFFDGRGAVSVTSDHPEIEAGKEITVGKGRAGRVRVMVAVPDTLEPGTHQLNVVLDGWHKASGGLGARLEHTTKLELVVEIPGSGSGTGKPTKSGTGNSGPGEGSNVALKWSSPDLQQGWERPTVGEVEQIPAEVLAQARPEYAELAGLGATKIPTIVLNEEYPPFKKYLSERNKDLTKVERPKEQYAIGVGVALLLLEREVEARRKASLKEAPDDGFVAEAQRAAARAVLAVMPSFDVLAREAGLE